MKSFAISDYKATSADPDTCTTTYKVAIEGTYDGKDQSSTYNAGSLWKKHTTPGMSFTRSMWALCKTNHKSARSLGRMRVRMSMDWYGFHVDIV
jgi:hypothetical protein